MWSALPVALINIELLFIAPITLVNYLVLSPYNELFLIIIYRIPRMILIKVMLFRILGEA